MKYLSLIIIGARRSLVYKWSVLFSVITAALSIILLRHFWSALLTDPTAFQHMFNYSIISLVLASVYTFKTPDKIMQQLRSGEIVCELLHPWSYVPRLIFEDIGTLSVNMIFRIIPIILFGTLVYNFKVPLTNLLPFIVCMVLSFTILFFLRTCVGLISFWVIEASSMNIFLNILINFFSGKFLPAWIMPNCIGSVMLYLPFIWIFEKPIEVLLSTSMELSDYIIYWGCQLLWVVGLYIVYNIMWKRAMKKLSIYGG